MSLRSMLVGLSKKDDTSSTPEGQAELFTRIQEVITRYEQLDGVHPDFKRDIKMLLVAALDFSDTLSAPFYSIDEVLHSTTIVIACLNRTLDYAKMARPRVQGFAVANLANNTIIASSFCTSEGEANARLAELQKLAIGANYKVVPVDLTSNYVHQPVIGVLPSTLTKLTSDQPLPIPTVDALSLLKDLSK